MRRQEPLRSAARRRKADAASLGDGPVFVDVAPGSCHIAPESFGVDRNQTRDVNLAAGQTIYVQILDDPTRISSGDKSEFRRDTFYTWVVPATVARAEMHAPM